MLVRPFQNKTLKKNYDRTIFDVRTTEAARGLGVLVEVGFSLIPVN